MGDQLNRLLEGNERFLEEKPRLDFSPDQRKAKTELGQHPYAIIVCCSDARVCPEVIFDATIGDLFVIRVAGNVISDAELASIEYAAEHLGVSFAMVLGHTHCGAIHSAISGESGRYVPAILDKVKTAIAGISDEREASKANAQHWATYIQDRFPHLEVVPGLYEIDTGFVKIIRQSQSR